MIPPSLLILLFRDPPFCGNLYLPVFVQDIAEICAFKKFILTKPGFPLLSANFHPKIYLLLEGEDHTMPPISNLKVYFVRAYSGVQNKRPTSHIYFFQMRIRTFLLEPLAYKFLLQNLKNQTFISSQPLHLQSSSFKHSITYEYDTNERF